MSAEATQARTVVICGSMKNLELMQTIGEILRSTGLDAITPVPDEPAGGWTAQSAKELKRLASRRHMNFIRDRATAAVLVVNVDRNGTRDYVGPNAFAEISVAFADERRIFLLQRMPAVYAEELDAWGVECLHGDLNLLAKKLGSDHEVDKVKWHTTFQSLVA